jgi:plasmid maintenance system antidote protein VapI
MDHYLIGQRVIVGDEIATVIRPPATARSIERDNQTWVRFQNGVEQWRANHNVNPLPNGQL